ncbi:hypothetical protein BO71DRAFT_431150 [Aspergillus ellipticus CBS 707.79]|uniref:Uncharacterized protein n=1 Tax=Aspergillus ellipticus CBS 707.79 TaxID=1448320 RepID=A0A319D6Y6_9EURO|nr:hypothetical protein BO71DRAFT_431150 [Aspergillus ellipticus CBS 707.79]
MRDTRVIADRSIPATSGFLVKEYASQWHFENLQYRERYISGTTAFQLAIITQAPSELQPPVSFQPPSATLKLEVRKKFPQTNKMKFTTTPLIAVIAIVLATGANADSDAGTGGAHKWSCVRNGDNADKYATTVRCNRMLFSLANYPSYTWTKDLAQRKKVATMTPTANGCVWYTGTLHEHYYMYGTTSSIDIGKSEVIDC